jgi:hypothetical protein
MLNGFSLRVVVVVWWVGVCVSVWTQSVRSEAILPPAPSPSPSPCHNVVEFYSACFMCSLGPSLVLQDVVVVEPDTSIQSLTELLQLYRLTQPSFHPALKSDLLSPLTITITITHTFATTPRPTSLSTIFSRRPRRPHRLAFFALLGADLPWASPCSSPTVRLSDCPTVPTAPRRICHQTEPGVTVRRSRSLGSPQRRGQRKASR